MATSTADAFNQFYERIKPSAAVNATITTRQRAVVETLKRAFPSTSNVRFRSADVIGSIGRGTASKPISDIDLLVHLHVDTQLWTDSYSKDSSKFLYRVRDSLGAKTTVQKDGARGQAVRLFYADGLTVDVAAVEKYNTGSFAIPDGTGGWLKTNPFVHAQYLKDRDALVVGDLKRFIQIAKQWNQAHSTRLHSFHLEMLAARTFSSLNNDRRDALRIFFNFNRNNLSVQDPAGFSGDLSSYLSTSQRQAVNDSLGTALDQATRANAAEARGNHKEAIRLWGIILGSDFPTYG